MDDAQRAVQAAQYDQTLRQQAEDAERLASAWARGAGAAREAALANEVLAEARKRGLDPERDAGEIGNIGAGVWARDQAQRTQQFAQMASEQRRAVDLANAEFGMLGASNAERAKMVAMLQAANDLRDKGADLTDAGTRAYIEQAGELARVNSQLQDAAQNAANITQPITTGLEDIIVGAKGAGDAVKALGEDLKRIAARQLITKPFETAVSGALTRLMSGGVSIANDNRPTPANDPGGLDRLITTVKGGLGSSSSNPMWVTMASGSAAFDIGAMASASPMPVAIKDAGGLEGIIQGAATKYGVDPAIIKGIIERESSWRADAVNKTSGAAGLMQLMPANVRAYGVSNAFDPAQNIETGTRILKEHLVRAGGDIDKALSTYSGHITKDGSAYVSAVKASAEGYRQAGAGLRLVVDNTQGVTAAQESQLQAMLDAVPVQRAATSGAQNLTAAQDSLIASVLGTSKANDAALQVVDLQTRSISALGANAISVAEGLGDAADGASSLADASESSSNILLRGAQAVYSGFTGVLGSLWNSVSGLFGGVSAGGGGAVGAASTTQASLLGGGFGNVSSALSLANSGYSIYTGANTLGTTVANFATSTTGQSLGLATSAVGPTGPVIPQLTGAGEALTGVAGTIGSALPYGAVGGFLGGLAGTAMNSKAGGAAVGAVTGAGSAALGSYLMTGSMMGPWGLAAAAIIGGVMAALGTTKASVGPNAQGHILYEDGRYVQGPSAADNGGDDGNVKTVTASLATGFNALADAYGLTLKARNYGYWEGGTDKATGIGVHNDPEELIRQILRDATATDPTSNVAKALANETVRNSGDLEEIQKYLDVAKKIDSATEAFTELNKSLTQVQANAKAAAAENWKAIDEEIKTADKIGLGSEYRKSLENSIRSSFEGAVQAATPWETAMATLRGETEAWIEAVTRWNVGVSEAEIRADAAAKAAKLQAQAVAEYTASLYDAQGRDYLTSLSGIEDARDTTRRNLTAVGVDDAAGRANTLVTSQFTSVLSGLDLAQLTDVTRTLGGEVGALAETMRVAAQAVVTEDLTVRALRAQGKAADADAMELRLKQEREYRQAEKDGYDAASLAGLRWLQGLEAQTAATERAAQAAAYNADVTSRMYAAVGANRISGLLSLDQQQAVELAQARDAGYDTTRLQEVQAAERGQKAFDLAKADVLEWYDREIAAKQELVTSLQDGALKVSQAAKQFKAAGDSIRLSEDAPISPQERLAEAKRQWDAALGTINSSTASDGEKDTARSALASLGQTLVSIEKTNSAGTARALFDEVLGVLDRLGDPATYGAGTATAEADLKVAQDQLKEMQRARTEAANLGQRQLGSLDSIVSIMNQSYSLWQASLVPANQNTGTPTSATLDQMLKGLTKDTLGGIIEWAKAQGPETYQKALVAADTRLGWENNSYRYAAPADVATMDGTGFGINDALGFLKQFGYTGQFDSNANAFIQSHGLADAYTSFLRDFKARNSLEGKRARLEAFSAAQIEAAFGGMPDIQAARLADPAFDLAQWFRQTGINEVLAGQRQIPGFATGTLSTPPGAVWVGERGPELMWQAGGAAVASSADSLRIAGIYASAVNDRWSATNVSDFRPAAPARPERGNGRDAAILAELRRLNDQIAELRKGVHAEEGSAQNQRGVLLTKLIKTVEALQAELAEQKPRLTA
ncbi:hypothetical protein J2847_006798 [Azospirillum agricola]|nr:hypothetical protein [Azospirillum agricola]